MFSPDPLSWLSRWTGLATEHTRSRLNLLFPLPGPTCPGVRPSAVRAATVGQPNLAQG